MEEDVWKKKTLSTILGNIFITQFSLMIYGLAHGQEYTKIPSTLVLSLLKMQSQCDYQFCPHTETEPINPYNIHTASHGRVVRSEGIWVTTITITHLVLAVNGWMASRSSSSTGRQRVWGTKSRCSNLAEAKTPTSVFEWFFFLTQMQMIKTWPHLLHFTTKLWGDIANLRKAAHVIWPLYAEKKKTRKVSSLTILC